MSLLRPGGPEDGSKLQVLVLLRVPAVIAALPVDSVWCELTCALYGRKHARV